MATAEELRRRTEEAMSEYYRRSYPSSLPKTRSYTGRELSTAPISLPQVSSPLPLPRYLAPAVPSTPENISVASAVSDATAPRYGNTLADLRQFALDNPDQVEAMFSQYGALPRRIEGTDKFEMVSNDLFDRTLVKRGLANYVTDDKGNKVIKSAYDNAKERYDVSKEYYDKMKPQHDALEKKLDKNNNGRVDWNEETKEYVALRDTVNALDYTNRFAGNDMNWAMNQAKRINRGGPWAHRDETRTERKLPNVDALPHSSKFSPLIWSEHNLATSGGLQPTREGDKHGTGLPIGRSRGFYGYDLTPQVLNDRQVRERLNSPAFQSSVGRHLSKLAYPSQDPHMASGTAAFVRQRGTPEDHAIIAPKAEYHIGGNPKGIKGSLLDHEDAHIGQHSRLIGTKSMTDTGYRDIQPILMEPAAMMYETARNIHETDRGAWHPDAKAAAKPFLDVIDPMKPRDVDAYNFGRNPVGLGTILQNIAPDAPKTITEFALPPELVPANVATR